MFCSPNQAFSGDVQNRYNLVPLTFAYVMNMVVLNSSRDGHSAEILLKNVSHGDSCVWRIVLLYKELKDSHYLCVCSFGLLISRLKSSNENREWCLGCVMFD